MILPENGNPTGTWQLTKWTRRSENDDTPQPLDQRMESPLIGQQIGPTGSNCWDTVFAKFDLGKWSKVNVISRFKSWVQHPVDSHPFRSMSIDPHIPKIQLLQNLTLKIQGQGHRWGQSSKSQCESNIQSTHISFVPCQSALPFLGYSHFKIWPWKSKVKVIAQGHKVGPTSYRLTSLSFHVNRPSHSWDTASTKFDLEIPKSRTWVRSKFKVTMWIQHPIDSHPLRSMSIGPALPGIQPFQKLTLTI